MSRQNFNAFDRVVRRLRSRQVKRNTTDGDRVIDVGCGQHNWLVNSVESWAPDSLGIDPNLREEFRDARGTTETIEQIVADSERRFDTAVSLAVIEHLEVDNATRHVELIGQSLKPDGKLVITTPTPRAKPVLEFLAFKLRAISADEIADHKYYYSTDEVRALVTAAGFDVQQAKTFQFGFNQMVVAKRRPSESGAKGSKCRPAPNALARLIRRNEWVFATLRSPSCHL